MTMMSRIPRQSRQAPGIRRSGGRVLLIGWLLTLVLAGCVSLPTPAAPVESTPPAPGTPEPQASPAHCLLTPITPPVMPTEIPGYTQVDPATGLHMTGTVKQIDLAGYRLKVTGKVDHPLSLAYDELRCLPRIECASCTLICPGFFTDHATWAGAPLAYVLKLAGIQDGASQVTLVSADGYATPLTLNEALSDDAMLAYEQNGQPLPILHGFPVRAVLPSRAGGKWVKWLVEIIVN
jgi:DMSO/TMAO reductase YedYZ molybdopterin-dependent catalytic subunit